MSDIIIREMNTDDEHFIGTCPRVGGINEIIAHSPKRITWLRDSYQNGLRVKVALLDNHQAGFIYLMPIEICPWGPIGKDLLAFPCMFVKSDAEKQGVGLALIADAEEEAKAQNLKGIVTIGHHDEKWYMPAAFFIKNGFEEGDREGDEAVMWKAFEKGVKPPRLLRPQYKYHPVPGKVVVDLFWHSFCGTSAIEAQRVREVVMEFGDDIILNDYCVDDRDILLKNQVHRGIFVNGEQKSWDFGAHKEGIRESIAEALENQTVGS